MVDKQERFKDIEKILNEARILCNRYQIPFIWVALVDEEYKVALDDNNVPFGESSKKADLKCNTITPGSLSMPIKDDKIRDIIKVLNGFRVVPRGTDFEESPTNPYEVVNGLNAFKRAEDGSLFIDDETEEDDMLIVENDEIPTTKPAKTIKKRAGRPKKTEAATTEALVKDAKKIKAGVTKATRVKTKNIMPKPVKSSKTEIKAPATKKETASTKKTKQTVGKAAKKVTKANTTEKPTKTVRVNKVTKNKVSSKVTKGTSRKKGANMDGLFEIDDTPIINIKDMGKGKKKTATKSTEPAKNAIAKKPAKKAKK